MDNNLVQHGMDQDHHEQEREISLETVETFKCLKAEMNRCKVENEQFMRNVTPSSHIHPINHANCGKHETRGYYDQI